MAAGEKIHKIDKSYDWDAVATSDGKFIRVGAEDYEDAILLEASIQKEKNRYGLFLSVTDDFGLKKKKVSVCVCEDAAYEWAKMIVTAIDLKRKGTFEPIPAEIAES